jgi:hypothetical protein
MSKRAGVAMIFARITASSSLALTMLRMDSFVTTPSEPADVERVDGPDAVARAGVPGAGTAVAAPASCWGEKRTSTVTVRPAGSVPT